MRKSKPPTWIRYTHLIKRYLEVRSGLSLGDVLNVALFVLSTGALLVGFAGALIAWIAYVDAHKGGESQLSQLQAATQSLAAERFLVETEEQRLRTMSGQLATNIEIEKEQQKALQQSLAFSTKEVAALDKQVELQSRAPEVNLLMACFSDQSENIGSHNVVQLELGPRTFKYNGVDVPFTSSIDLKASLSNAGEGGRVFCSFYALNIGDGVMSHFFLRTNLSVAARSGPLGAIKGTRDGIPLMVQTVTPQQIAANASEPPLLAVDENAFQYLTQDTAIFPSKTHDKHRTILSRMYVTIPKDVTIIDIGLEFGGDQQSTIFYHLYLSIKHEN